MSNSRSSGLLTISLLALATAGLGTATRALAQCPAGWLPGQGAPGVSGTAVNALGVLPSGDVMVGGTFSVPTINCPATAVNIARYNPTAQTWSSVGASPDGSVQAILVTGTDVFVGGTFSNIGGIAASRIARYNSLTGVWSALGSGVSGTAVYSLAAMPNGDLYVGGYMSAAGGVAASGIARYSTTTGTWSNLGGGVTGGIGGVFAIAPSPTGELYVGGGFTTAAGLPGRTNIARYNPTLVTWAALGSGVGGTTDFVDALRVLPTGELIVGGVFTSAGGVSGRNNIAKYSPATSTWSALGAGTSGGVTVGGLGVLPSGELVVAGAFSTAGAVAANNVARYNTTTGIWSAFDSGTNGVVRAQCVLPSGDLLIGGEFTSAGGIALSRIARYYQQGAPAPTINIQPLSIVANLAGNAVFYVGATPGAGSSGSPTYQWRRGGTAISAASTPSAATAALRLTNVQPDDIGSYDCLVTNSCGGTGTLSSTVTLAFASPPPSVACNIADIAGGGPNGTDPDGIIDGNDFVAFINAFALGC